MISVVVPSKNNVETLDNCLRSIVDSHGDKEIIVVDAHSKDRTPKILERYKNQVKVVYDQGKGIGIARNMGVEVSSGEIVCFVDADAYVSKDHFTRIERYFKENPEVGIVNVEVPLRLSDRPTYIEKLRYIETKARRRINPLVGGCFMSFRRKAFYDAGGFWNFPPYGFDDGDFTVRVFDKGWKKGSVKTESWHQLRRTLPDLWKEMWGWGKGKSCFDKKYSNHPYVVGVRRKRKLYRIFGKKYWRYSELTRLLAPITALMFIFKCKTLGVYFYYIIKEWTGTLGYMWGWLTWAKNIQQG